MMVVTAELLNGSLTTCEIISMEMKLIAVRDELDVGMAMRKQPTLLH